MKVTCDRERLREGLGVASNIIPTKSPKPVLSNVCLVATEGALELVGTDMDVAVRYRIDDVQVEEPGTAVVPARMTTDFVRDLVGERVELDTSEGNCRITSGADSCELVTFDADEYPVVARFTEEGSYPVQGGVFSALVGRTIYAVAREQGRYAMHGVRIEVEEGLLKLVASDGRRLAIATAPIDAAGTLPPPVMVPTKGMQLFTRVISDPLDLVRLHFSENQIGLKSRNAEVFARLLDGEFPRYEAVVLNDAAEVVEADAEMLARKIRLVANVTGEEARAVRFSLKKGHLELFGQSAGRGEATAHMEVDFKGKQAEIAFNPDYVVEGLKHCEGTTVKLEFNDRTAPGKFTLGESTIYVVMPITVDV